MTFLSFLQDNLILVAVACISGGMLLWPLLRERAAGPALSTLQATQLINSRNAVVVDIRTADDFAKGSLPNARNIPLDKLADRAKDLKKDKPVILVCNTGTTAGRAVAQFKAAGFTDVHVLGGGVVAWKGAGLPLRTA